MTFHTWRHFFNTMLRTSGITDAKVQAIVGHTNLKMTDHSTQFNVTEFTDVKNVLETFLVEHDKKVPVKQKTEMAS
jgi:integrase